MDRDKLVAGMLTGVSPALSAEQVAMINAALKDPMGVWRATCAPGE